MSLGCNCSQCNSAERRLAEEARRFAAEQGTRSPHRARILVKCKKHGTAGFVIYGDKWPCQDPECVAQFGKIRLDGALCPAEEYFAGKDGQIRPLPRLQLDEGTKFERVCSQCRKPMDPWEERCRACCFGAKAILVMKKCQVPGCGE